MICGLEVSQFGPGGAEVTGPPTIDFLESSICNYSMAPFTCVCHKPHVSGVIFLGIAGGRRDVLFFLETATDCKLQ